MLRACLLSFFLLVMVVANAQSFEGVLEFKKQSPTDTLSYVYTVKGDQVRIDEIRSITHRVVTSMLLNLETGTLHAINHEQKTWERRKPTGKAIRPATSLATTTTHSKSLFGYKCIEYTVNNTSTNTTMSYWVASGKFDFFVPMLELLNSTDDFARFYLALPVKNGALPFLAVTYAASGKEVARMEVTRIEKKKVAEAQFSVPTDYTETK